MCHKEEKKREAGFPERMFLMANLQRCLYQECLIVGMITDYHVNESIIHSLLLVPMAKCKAGRSHIPDSCPQSQPS
jgi:hypothetical protein